MSYTFKCKIQNTIRVQQHNLYLECPMICTYILIDPQMTSLSFKVYHILYWYSMYKYVHTRPFYLLVSLTKKTF